jgi:inosine/xanthosine triphosphate pyrophosphatase family protein
LPAASHPDMPTLLFATRNLRKKQLFSPVFQARGIHFVTLLDVDMADIDVDEVGATAEENALLKARAFHSPEWPLVLGDDAGLEIDALNGEPGVQARRWNGRFADDVADEVWRDYLLERMHGVPLSQRTARYVAAWAVITPDGQAHMRRFIRPFRFADRPLRPITPGAPMGSLEIYERGRPSPAEQIATEWTRWGILETILASDQANP